MKSIQFIFNSLRLFYQSSVADPEFGRRGGGVDKRNEDDGEKKAGNGNDNLD